MMEAKGKLLIVDDDPAIRIPISAYLTEVGYQVRMAEHGLAGLAEIEKEAPGILLSDLNMPQMSGFELLSVVRRCFPAIRTIAMSATISTQSIPEGVIADAFFQKGDRLPGLLEVIESLRSLRDKSLDLNV